MKNSNFASTGARFFKNRRFQKSSHFGRVWGRFWEATNLDFRTFFVFLFEANFKEFFDRRNNRKKWPTERGGSHLEAGPAECAWPGGEIERG